MKTSAYLTVLAIIFLVSCHIGIAQTGHGAGGGLLDRVDRLEQTLPIGTVVLFAGARAPVDWLICDGAVVNSQERPELAKLAQILNNNFDHNKKVCRLPDLRGRTPIGAGTGDKLAQRELGEKGGAETHTLELRELPKETNFGLYIEGNGYGLTKSLAHQNKVAICGAQEGRISGKDEGGKPHNIMQPFTVVNYIIKYR